MKTHEYAFDVKLNAVIRIKAKTAHQARLQLNHIDSEDVMHTCSNEALITEVSVDDCDPHLFEVDKEEVDE